NIERLPYTMRARKLGRGPRGPRGRLLKGVREDNGVAAHDLDLVSVGVRHRAETEDVTRGYGRRRGRGAGHRMAARRAAPRDRRERDVRRSCYRCAIRVRDGDEYRTRGRALRDRRERQGPVGLGLRLTDV